MSQLNKRGSMKGSLSRAASSLVGALLAALPLWSEPMSAANVGSQSAAQSEQEARLLEPGKPIERELAGGQSHSYRLTLASGQYLHMVVEQRGVDVVIILFGPDGRKLVEVDSPNGTQGPESLRMVTEAAGSYRLEVRSLERFAAAGRYEARIEELRATAPQDSKRITAQKTFAEGMQLQARGMPALLRKAIEKYAEALPLLREVEDRRGEADALQATGFAYSTLGDKQKALEYYRQALPLRQALGDRRGEAEMLNNIGVIYWSLGEKQKALDHYVQALPLLRAVGDRRTEAAALHNLGTLYVSLNDQRKALEYYDQALPPLRALGDRRGEASALTSIGTLYTFLGENRKALDYFGLALPLWRTLGDSRMEAAALTSLGKIHDTLGEPQPALDFYGQALQVLRTVGDRQVEAGALNNIGKLYAALGEQQKAFDYFGQALSLWRTLSDRQGEGNTLHNIGAVYGLLGDDQRALDYFGQALPLLRAANDRQAEAFTLANMGAAFVSSGEKQKALDHFNQALLIWRAAGYRGEEAIAFHNLGAVYESLGEKQKALDYFIQALQLNREAGNRAWEGNTLAKLGLLHVAMNEPQKALDYLNQSLLLNQAVGDRRAESYTLYGMAQAERYRGRLKEARAQIEKALTIIESLRAKVSGPELRAFYFVSAQVNYEFYIDLLMRLHQLYPAEGHEAMALQASERARARSLIELLTETRADIRQGIDRDLLERERSLQRDLNAKEQRRIQALNGKHTPEQVAALEKELDGLLTQYQEVQAQIRGASPRYAALTQPQPLTLSEIQRQLLDDDTMLLEYTLGEERSYLWLVSSNSITSFELPARAVVEDASRRVYDLLTARVHQMPGETAAQRRARIAQSDKDYPAAVTELSRIVLGPAAAQLGKKRLVIVSGGALQYIPFAVLPRPVRVSASSHKRVISGQPMMLEHEIISLPSASTLAVLRRELAGRHPAPKIAAVLADPVFESNDPRVKTVAGAQQKPAGNQNDRQDTTLNETFVARTLADTGAVNPGQLIPRLPYSQREAATIRSLAPAGLRRLALGFEASYATATSPELSEYRIVHFATHGLLNSKQPELSGILLSLFDEQGRPHENGLLRLGEIFNLKLPAELVVLSACQTALGKEIKGEGLVGLTRGFMYAGAPRVVASLWKVDDRATAELMKRFYEGMLGKRRLRPAEALRQAQIAMWRQAEWRSPIYWGAFTFQGEWK